MADAQWKEASVGNLDRSQADPNPEGAVQHNPWCERLLFFIALLVFYLLR